MTYCPRRWKRQERPYRSLLDLLVRVPLNRDERRTLAALIAFNGFGGHRRDALWQVESPVPVQPDLFMQDQPATTTASSPLVPMEPGERLQADFDGMNLTTGPHAMALLRPHLPLEVWRAAELIYAEGGQRVLIAGNVICRQRPGTAKGFVFVSLEDETGITNIVVAPALFEQQRLTLSQEAFLLIEGWVQMGEGPIHVKAGHLEGLRHGGMAHARSHDFH